MGYRLHIVKSSALTSLFFVDVESESVAIIGPDVDPRHEESWVRKNAVESGMGLQVIHTG
jgi:hypothetical protein